MIEKMVLDNKEIEKTFRIVNSKLERVDLRCKRKEGKWKEVINKSNRSDGYCHVRYKDRMYQYHTLLWTLYYRENIAKGLEIDHINGNKIDNRIENLRLVTQRQNCQNKVVHRNGAKVGASYSKKEKKYRTQIRVNLNNIQIGCFCTEEEAHKAYLIACTRVEEYIDNASFRDIVREELSKQMGVAQ